MKPQRPQTCPKCQGRIVAKGDMVICAQCGTVFRYIRRHPPAKQHTRPAPSDRPLGLTTQQAIHTFSNPDLTRRWLHKRMWPAGPTCPKCGQPSPPTDEDASTCAHCGNRHTPVTGTPMENSPVTPGQWLDAAHATLAAWPEPPDIHQVARRANINLRQAQSIVDHVTAQTQRGQDIFTKEITARRTKQ